MVSTYYLPEIGIATSVRAKWDNSRPQRTRDKPDFDQIAPYRRPNQYETGKETNQRNSHGGRQDSRKASGRK